MEFILLNLPERIDSMVFLFGSLSRVGVNKNLCRGRKLFLPLIYVKDRKIRFLKFSKLRYPKAFRLITLIALFVPSVKPLE